MCHAQAQAQIVEDIQLYEAAASDSTKQEMPANRPAAHVFAPPAPAQFCRRQPGAARTACRSTPSVIACEASLIQSMRRNICAALVVPELCDVGIGSLQEDLWAAVDESFLQ